MLGPIVDRCDALIDLLEGGRQLFERVRHPCGSAATSGSTHEAETANATREFAPFVIEGP